MALNPRVINVVLIILIAVLAINLIKPLPFITGNIAYSFDLSESECYFINSGKTNEIPIDSCCYELQKQLSCVDTDGYYLKCYISETSGKFYKINYKTLKYCLKEGYDVEVEE